MTSGPVARLARVLAAAVLIAHAVALPATVLGHAELDTVTPADKSTVPGPVSEIVMTFTEALDPGGSSIRIVDAVGGLILEGGVVDTGNPKVLRLFETDGLTPATYTIRWTSKSVEDGDIARGTTTFTVTAAATPSPTVAVSATASNAASAAASSTPSTAASAVPSPSAPPTSPAGSTSDALIPIIAVVVAIAALGLWLLRGRARRGA
jgi:methionine-rich copper-binding protein CopC